MRYIGLVLALTFACQSAEKPADDMQFVRFVSVEPQGLIARTVPIEFELSIPVVTSEQVSQSFPASRFLLISPMLESRVRFDSPSKISMIPQQGFAPATNYRISVRPDAFGAKYEVIGERHFLFRTPSFALESSRAWRRGSSIELILRFTHPVQMQQLRAATTFYDARGNLLRPRFVDEGAHVRHRVLFSPLNPGKTQKVEFSIEPGLGSSLGGRPIGKSVKRTVKIEDEAPLVEATRPVQIGHRWAVALDLPSQIDTRRLSGAVTAGGLPADVVWSPSGPLVLGVFPSNTTTSLALGHPLVDKTLTISLDLPKLAPALKFADPSAVLALSEDMVLQIEHEAVQHLVVEAFSIVPENLPLMLDRIVPARLPPVLSLARPLGRLRWSASSKGQTTVDITSLVGGTSNSAIFVRVWDEARPWISDERYILSRGITLVAKSRPEYLWAKVQAQDGPLHNAQTDLIDQNGARLASAKTNDFGEVSLRWNKGTAAVLSVQAGGRFAVLPLAGARLPAAIVGGARSSANVVLFPERHVYAPGQVLDLSVVALNDYRKPIKQETFELRIKRYDGTTLVSKDVKTDKFGTSAEKIPLPEETRPGHYRLELMDGSGQVVAKSQMVVQAFGHAKSRIRVRSRDELENNSIVFEVRTERLAKGTRLVATCKYRRLEEFGGLPRPLDLPANTGDVKPISVQLVSSDYSQAVYCPIPQDTIRPWEVRLVVHGAGLEPRHHTRVVSAASYYLGLKAASDSVDVGKPMAFEAIVVDQHGEAIESGEVTMMWRSWRAKDGYQLWHQRLIPKTVGVMEEEQSTVVSLTDGRASVSFIPKRAGTWTVGATMGNVSHERNVFVFDSGSDRRPLDLHVEAVKRGVRLALPFAGHVLLTDEQSLVREATWSRVDQPTVLLPFNRKITKKKNEETYKKKKRLKALLIGEDGRWTTASWIDSAQQSLRFIPELQVSEELPAGQPIEVEVKIPSWVKEQLDKKELSGRVRVFAVPAHAAPSKKSLIDVERKFEYSQPTLTTLFGSAYDNINRENTDLFVDGLANSYDSQGQKDSSLTRPATFSVSTDWTDFAKAKSKDGSRDSIRLELDWPDRSGQVRIYALVQLAGYVGVGVVDRIVGTGLSLSLGLPSRVRAGDKILVPVRIENASTVSKEIELSIFGEGFRVLKEPSSVLVKAESVAKLRVPVEVINGGSLKVSSEFGSAEAKTKMLDSAQRKTFRGRGSSATRRVPAVLPTPASLNADSARIVVGPLLTVRFAAAVQALLATELLDAERAAAVVLGGLAMRGLTKALGGKAKLNDAISLLERGLSATDPWVRVFVAHAAIEATKAKLADLEDLSRATLREVAQDRQFRAAAYANFLLANLGVRQTSTQPPASGVSSEVHSFLWAADVLRSDEQTPVTIARPSFTPSAIPQQGRFTSVVVDSLTLLALDSVKADDPAAVTLTEALVDASRDGRWKHPVEEALALWVIARRVSRQTKIRNTRGTLLFSKTSKVRYQSNQVSVFSIPDLETTPEVTVSDSGTAEVGLILEGNFGVQRPSKLSLTAQWKHRFEQEPPFQESDSIGLEITIKNESPQPEALLLQVPLPAGFLVDEVPVGSIEGAFSYLMPLTVLSGSTWVGRVRGRASFAGIWGMPPVRAWRRYENGAEVSTIVPDLTINVP